MEPKLGANLDAVRIHTGGDSAEATKGFGARAFTVGENVHFNAGEFQPGSKDGDRLLAHELTHVVQGQKAGVQRKADEGDAKADKKDDAEVSDPAEPAEKEADAKGDAIADELHEGKDANGAKDVKEAAPGVGAKLLRKIFLSPDKPGQAGPQDNNIKYPKTPEEYRAHLREKFSGEIAQLKQLQDEFKANGGEAMRQSQVLKADGDAINKLREEALKNQVVLDAAEQHQGKSQGDLRKQAQALLKQNKEKFGTDRLKADEDKKLMKSILDASMLLSAQVDPEGTGLGRTLYGEKIDKQEMTALEHLLEQAKLPTPQKGELLSMYRREARVFLREEIMTDEHAREICYLRDLGLSGSRTGVTSDELLKKELKKLGVEIVAEATEQDLEKAWQGIIASSKRSNPDATAAATAGAKPSGGSGH